MDDELEKAFATIGNAINKQIDDDTQAMRNDDFSKIDPSKPAELFFRFSHTTGNPLPELEKCTRLSVELSQVTSINDLPAQEEIEFCINYLIQDNNWILLSAIYSNLACVYETTQKTSGTSKYNNTIYQYYSLSIQALALGIETYERNGTDKRLLEMGKNAFIYTLADISVFLNKTHQSLDIKYVRMGYKYALENNDLKIAKVIINNFARLYHIIESNRKNYLELTKILMEIQKRIIDNGLEHNLKVYIENAQCYSNTYQFDLGIVNEQTGLGFLYAAYYAEHSNQESGRYRDYECAINNYWYSKFAGLSVNSVFWEKAYQYAKKFPFNRTCSTIVKEYRELQKSRRS